MPADPILIVDHNTANLKLARTVLAAEGFDVRIASDAEEALKVLGSFVPRLILMDVQLPGTDGLELPRLLKADPATRAIRIVGLTARAPTGDPDRVLAAGCDGYMAKPIDTRRLADQLRDFLTASQ